MRAYQVKAVVCVSACSVWYTFGLVVDKIPKELLSSCRGGHGFLAAHETFESLLDAIAVTSVLSNV